MYPRDNGTYRSMYIKGRGTNRPMDTRDGKKGYRDETGLGIPEIRGTNKPIYT